MYQIADTQLTINSNTFADAVMEIAEWYADYPEWATGSATQAELDLVASAIESVDPPVDGDASDLKPMRTTFAMPLQPHTIRLTGMVMGNIMSVQPIRWGCH